MLPTWLRSWIRRVPFARRLRRFSRVLAIRSALPASPVSREWGFERGTPIDRFYIERFLEVHSTDVRGRVLEIGDNSYTRRFGGGRVARSDVLHVEEGNPDATIVGDLTRAHHLPSDAFDCIILTQTLHLIYDPRSAIVTLHRILRPAGVLLLTAPGITPTSHQEWPGSWYWSFTTNSAARLLSEAFGGEHVTVEGHGNVMAACAFLYGLACEDVRRADLEHLDPDYQVIVTARAIKSGGQVP
jgi:SAM-dependent methyltransferase